MASNPSNVLDRLERQMRPERVDLIVSNDTHGDAARHMDEEYHDNEAPILARFTNFIPEGAARSQPDESLRALTNFTIQEFDTLWGFVESDLAMAWTTGRGRQSFVSPRDAVFMTLTVLKHYDTRQKHAIDFDLGLSSLEKVVHKVIGIIESVLYKHLVKPVKMSDQVAARKTFENYPYALYATDVKFQQAYRPSGRFNEQKAYFSAKYKLYGFKLECSVALPDVAVDLSRHSPGSASDLTLLLGRTQIHRHMLRKEPQAAAEIDSEPTDFPNSWAMLVDKGYQGAFRVLCVLQPKKQPRGGFLSVEDITRNRAVSSDRVIVENYFGRVCRLWNAMYLTYRWSEASYDQVSRLCFALTNFHVNLMPLRAQDSDHYLSILAKDASMGAQLREQRARTQREFRIRQTYRANPYQQRTASHGSDY
jgi:hypothetical protein